MNNLLSWINPRECLPEPWQQVLCYRDRFAIVHSGGESKREQREPWVIRSHDGRSWLQERGHIIAWALLPSVTQWQGPHQIITQPMVEWPTGGCLVAYQKGKSSPYNFNSGPRFGRVAPTKNEHGYHWEVFHRDKRDRGLPENQRLGPWFCVGHNEIAGWLMLPNPPV